LRDPGCRSGLPSLPRSRRRARQIQALRLNTRAAGEPPKPAAPKRGASLKLIASTPSEPDLDVSEAWIADLSDVGRQIPRPIS
jgi:hypothetical protein